MVPYNVNASFIFLLNTSVMCNDGAREVRAMVLLSMPCPPMPMLMSKEILDEVSFVHTDQVPCNSHDLIAHLLNKAAAARNCGEIIHSQRRLYQQNTSAILNQRFDDWKLTHPDDEIPPLEISYGFFAEFTRSYIQGYMSDPARELDIRFIPATDVDHGSILYCKCLDFARSAHLSVHASSNMSKS
jgi:hypothetical protein